MEARLITSPVFDWNYNSKARIRINQGGTSSGKTYAILQVIFMLLIQEKRIATVVGQDIPNLKTGALRDFQERILVESPWMLGYIADYNKTERIYRFKNGSLLEFTSFSDEQDAKSGKRDIAFFNEANGIPFTIYQQVAMRTTETVFLDYNPSEEFWVHDILMPSRESVTFYSNFTHNPFCPESVVEYLKEIKARDLEAWKVYGLGKTGSISELVFPKFTLVDEMPMYFKQQGFGLDFGYSNSPTAIVRCGVANERDLYVDEVCYSTGMKNQDIDKVLKRETLGMTVVCDSAEPKSIDTLKDLGNNVVGAEKGADSIVYGINLINDYDLHITARSLNILNERKRYKYKIDKQTGRRVNEPVKAFDHAFDAIRYWAIANLKKINVRKGKVTR